MNRRHLLILASFAALLLLARLGASYRTAPELRPPVAVNAGVPGNPPADTAALAGVPEEAARLLRSGRNWRAARVLREELRRDGDPPAGLVLGAARAEAGWGGWARVGMLLQGRPWLDGVAGGEGWYLLARAREEEGRWSEAADAYGRYLRGAGGDTTERRAVAELRRGLALLRIGRTDAGAAALDSAHARDPELAGWTGVLTAEAVAERGDTARIRRIMESDGSGGVAPARLTAVYLRALWEADDPRRTRNEALAARARLSGDEARARAAFWAGRAALALGDTAAARADLRAAFREAPGSGGGQQAAALFLRLGDLPAEDRLALGRVRERQGNPKLAAENYRIWLRSGRGTPAERARARLRMARFLFSAGQFGGAEREALALADAPAAVAAPALYLAGRAQFRQGKENTARSTWLGMVDRFPGSDAAADAVFLVADLRHDQGDVARARIGYRRVADRFPGTGRAALALMRLGGIAFQTGDLAGAARVWQEYRTRYPRGNSWPQATYWLARTRLAQGDTAAARALFRAVREREPLSFYAVRSAERLGEPFWPVPLADAPPDAPEARKRVEGWMRPVDVLRAAGLYAEADAEADRIVARAGDDPALLYPLAEALNRRGYTVHGVNLGYKLRRQAANYNPRLLRIVYPFPYREMVTAEAREKELDPFLVAALIRQESVFKARISSPVGARGLMQVMPETGAGLARGAGIAGWTPELLFNPEINVFLGTRFLAEQMRDYDERLPYVFSAYNAGPNRVEQWRERFPERRDAELFTERIPYEETRDYVKILTRNIALYRGLYGE